MGRRCRARLPAPKSPADWKTGLSCKGTAPASRPSCAADSGGGGTALPLWLEQSGGEGAPGRAGTEQCDPEGSSRFKCYGPLSVCLCAVRWVCVCVCAVRWPQTTPHTEASLVAPEVGSPTRKPPSLSPDRPLCPGRSPGLPRAVGTGTHKTEGREPCSLQSRRGHACRSTSL